MAKHARLAPGVVASEFHRLEGAQAGGGWICASEVDESDHTSLLGVPAPSGRRRDESQGRVAEEGSIDARRHRLPDEIHSLLHTKEVEQQCVPHPKRRTIQIHAQPKIRQSAAHHFIKARRKQMLDFACTPGKMLRFGDAELLPNPERTNVLRPCLGNLASVGALSMCIKSTYRFA
ncbi:hypothetical protein M409DRAFT_48730 [Zasmidium cellare ATCC 36951]|uniref:Uncharacterized protein n=1 Tax=Zasmidium cellare ATCC 36951 TaxID=1080233 RepID=A0A6A6D5W2_ZASCE|nr:uncharacterized protein M409DRAFT_48730 [Zasmidium cellare ATCC 36951]KAF2173808.1 hypothetical protein M409DRAFT_48730 [Zasmidium cellare ATCC 36951]